MSNSGTYLVGSINNQEFLSRGFIATSFQQIGQPSSAASSVVDLGIDLQNDDEMIAFVFNSTISGGSDSTFVEYISDIPFDQLEEQIQSQNDANNGPSMIDPNAIIPLLRDSSSLIRVIEGKDPTPNRILDEPIDFKRDGAARDAFTLQEGPFVPPPIIQPLLVLKQSAIVPPPPIAPQLYNTPPSSFASHHQVQNQVNSAVPIQSQIRMDPIKKEIPTTNNMEPAVPYPSTPQQETERIIIRTPVQPIVSTPLSSYSAQTPQSVESSLDQYSENGEDSAEKKKRKKEKKEKKEKKDKKEKKEKKEKKKEKKEKKEKKKRKKDEESGSASVKITIPIPQFDRQ